MKIASTTNRQVAVFVTTSKHNHTGAKWHLFATYANEFEASEAVQRAFDCKRGYTFAEIRTSQVFGLKKDAV